MNRSFGYTFPNKRTARAIHVLRVEELPLVFSELGIDYPRSVLVLIGGARGVSEGEMTHLHRLFVEALVPVVESLGAAIIDGGTNAGIMQMIGQAYYEVGATFPLIGVAATGTIALSNVTVAHSQNGLLEPHHTHFILVPGSEWGDESPWIARVASELAREKPSLAILVNGGEIAWDDIAHSVQAHRPVIVIEGSGRTADKLAEALHGEVFDERARELMASGLLRSINPSEGFDELTKTIKKMLK